MTLTQTVRSDDKATRLSARAMAWAASLSDGAILKTVFYLLLAGTISVLALDYFELNNQNASAEQYHPDVTPILPAIERPEVDPDNPAFNPSERITADPELLRQPLNISLEAGGILRLEGTIGAGSAEALRSELEARAEYIQTVSLNSPGGIVREAMEMGRLVREFKLNTSIASGNLCASSCPLAFAGGVERSAQPGASIGVHQIYAGTGETISPAQALSDAQSRTAEITRFLTGMGLDAALWLNALETPPDRLYYFTADELAEFKITTTEPMQ